VRTMRRMSARRNPDGGSDTLESDFREGFPLADAMHGSETRPWDRVLHGIANVLQKRGIPIDHMKVAEVWHYPTASFNDTMSAAEVWKWLDQALQGGPGGKTEFYEYSDRHFDHLYSIATPYRTYHPGELDFDKAVNDLIDREIKRSFPKIRRGTKKYAELHGQVLEKAKKVVSDELRERKERERREVKARYEKDIVPALNSIDRRVYFLRWKAGHIRAVLGSTPNVTATLAEAARLEKKASDLQTYWASVLSGSGG
jgi:hypothetical protein